MMYSMVFDDLATGTTADVFKTAASLIVADTVGHRCRLRSLNIGPSDDVPADQNITVKVSRIADVSAGTAGTKTAVTTANMAKKDPGSVDSLVSGGVNYTAEPTTYENESLFTQDMNARGGFLKEWSAKTAPIFTQDSLCGILVAPRATTAVRFSGSLEFEVF